MPASLQSIFEFVDVWNSLPTVEAVATRYGLPKATVLARARRLRDRGLPCVRKDDEAAQAAPRRAAPPPGRGQRPNHVQTTLSAAEYARLGRGVGVTADRVRRVLALGLDLEEALEAFADEGLLLRTPSPSALELEPESAPTEAAAPASEASAFDLFSDFGEKA